MGTPSNLSSVRDWVHYNPTTEVTTVVNHAVSDAFGNATHSNSAFNTGYGWDQLRQRRTKEKVTATEFGHQIWVNRVIYLDSIRLPVRAGAPAPVDELNASITQIV